MFLRLKSKVDIKLVNDFVAALEQLSSPELVLKVGCTQYLSILLVRLYSS